MPKKKETENMTEYKFTAAEAKIVEALLNPENRMRKTKDLCQLIGVSRETYYNSFEKPAFVAKYKEMSKELITKAVGPVINSFIQEANRGSFQHGKVILEMADMYREKQQTELTGANGGPIVVFSGENKLED